MLIYVFNIKVTILFQKFCLNANQEFKARRDQVTLTISQNSKRYKTAVSPIVVELKSLNKMSTHINNLCSYSRWQCYLKNFALLLNKRLKQKRLC